MAVLKLYCSQCGQRVSGDETFFGTTVTCPICSTEIKFPDAPAGGGAAPSIVPPPPGGEPAPEPPKELPKAVPDPPAIPEKPAPAASAAAAPPATGGLPAAPGLPAGPSLPEGAPADQSAPPPRPDAPEPPSTYEEAERAGNDDGDGEDAGPMPLIVLIAGALAAIPCFHTILLAPIAIILGHLTLMRMHGDDITKGKNKVVIGTALGYVSLIFLLLAALAWKFIGPGVMEKLGGG